MLLAVKASSSEAARSGKDNGMDPILPVCLLQAPCRRPLAKFLRPGCFESAALKNAIRHHVFADIYEQWQKVAGTSPKFCRFGTFQTLTARSRVRGSARLSMPAAYQCAALRDESRKRLAMPAHTLPPRKAIPERIQNFVPALYRAGAPYWDTCTRLRVMTVRPVGINKFHGVCRCRLEKH